jgi:hypothetical protein
MIVGYYNRLRAWRVVRIDSPQGLLRVQRACRGAPAVLAGGALVVLTAGLLYRRRQRARARASEP